MAQAIKLEESGRLDDSAQIYRELLRGYPESWQAHAGLGRVYYRSKRFREAAENFEQALKLKSGDPGILRWLARSYLRSGESQKVLDLLGANQKGQENHAWFHLLLARAYDAQDKIAEATQELRRAIKIDPRCPGAHFALGFIAWTTRDLAAAEREFREELSVNPSHRLARYYLAEVLMTRGNTGEAESVLRGMVRDFPKCYFAHFGMGKLEERNADFAKAAQQFREAVRIDPDQMEGHYRLAVVLRRLGQAAEADRELEVAKELRLKDTTQMGQGMGLMRARLPELE